MLKFGLIGCGRISSWHVNAIVQRKEARLVAICDIEASALAKTASNIPYPAQQFSNYKEMLELDLDVVAICTPSGLHPQMSIDALNSGKHVISEKPMSITVEQADAMIQAAKKNHKHLFIVKQNRYNKAILKLREAYEQGRFGKMLFGNASVMWARGQDYYDLASWRGTKQFDGSVLFNQASHHVDLLQWMMGPVKSVKAYAETLNHNIEASDTAIAVLKFASGALGTIQATTCVIPKNLEASITLLGEKGSAKIGGTSVNKIEHWEFTETKPGDETVKKETHTESSTVYGFGHAELYAKLIDGLIQKKIPKDLVMGEEAKKTIQILSAIHQSAETAKEVEL